MCASVPVCERASVRVCQCASVPVCLSVLLHAGDREEHWTSSSNMLYFTALRQGCSLNWKLAISGRLAGDRTFGIHLTLPSNVGFKGMYLAFRLFLETGFSYSSSWLTWNSLCRSLASASRVLGLKVCATPPGCFMWDLGVWTWVLTLAEQTLLFQPTILFFKTVSHWTWRSPIEPNCLASKPRDSLVSFFPA